MHDIDRTVGLWKFATYGFIAVAALFMLIPIYWVIVASTLPEEAIITTGATPRMIPGKQLLANFQALQENPNVDYLASTWHSLLIASVYTVLALFICSLAGFAFAKYEFRFKKPLFFSLFALMMLPIKFLVIPLFLLLANFNMTNTFAGIILPWAAYPIGVFLMRQNMKSIPDSLLESARMDGASEFQIFYRVALPTMKGPLAALAVILFLFQWDLFLYPLVILEQDKYTIPVAINQLVQGRELYYDQLMVAAAIAIIPMMIVFLALQKYFVRGILSGAVKE